MFQISNETPLAALTVGQFKNLLNDSKQELPEPAKETKKQYVHGLQGIKQMFGVSHATAFRYKETILKDAVLQNGRKIIVDVEKAIELFNAKVN